MILRHSLAAFGLVLFATLAVAQPRPDGKVLTGEWVGTWMATTGSTGYLAVTVETGEGESVRGSLYMAVTAPDAWGYYNRDVRFTGVFDGATLRITVPPALFFSMSVAGQSLRGSVQGQQTFGTVDLVRKR